MSSPEYQEYASGQSAKRIKALKLETLRFEICREILKTELHSPELATSNDQLTAVRLSQLLIVAEHNPSKFIPALKQIADVLAQIPFAEYHQKEHQLWMERKTEQRLFRSHQHG